MCILKYTGQLLSVLGHFSGQRLLHARQGAGLCSRDASSTCQLSEDVVNLLLGILPLVPQGSDLGLGCIDAIFDECDMLADPDFAISAYIADTGVRRGLGCLPVIVFEKLKDTFVFRTGLGDDVGQFLVQVAESKQSIAVDAVTVCDDAILMCRVSSAQEAKKTAGMDRSMVRLPTNR